MKEGTLFAANALDWKIKQLQKSLECFDWVDADYPGNRNLKIIIEFDDHDGDRIKQEISFFNDIWKS
jgi:hypothetical protein